ncbi:MAG: DUF6504 family protein [Chloroflexota bacterium]
MKDIETENGLPQRFTWQGRVHTVSAIANVWRIDDAWWQQRVWQDRFKLTTTTGLLVILSHDLLSDEWLLIRVYD